MGEIRRILVIGALGQIGSELTPALRTRYGTDNVVAADLHPPDPASALASGPFEHCDVTRLERIELLVEQYNIDAIVNMAALLSAVGEERPELCWEVNIGGLLNTLEAARRHGLKQVFCPSSIAAFGEGAPLENTPQTTVLQPSTMYGVTKVSGELLCRYYWQKFGVDARGLRYPGIISSDTLPGGGTTDYAVAIFYHAVEHGRYTCFLREDTRLPMMYMPDCVKATLDLIATDSTTLAHRANYNLAAMSFTAGELAAEIKKHLPGFEVDYDPDHRQAYADSWPRSIDDSSAREEWNWRPDYDLPAMVEDMLEKLTERHNRGALYPGKGAIGA